MGYVCVFINIYRYKYKGIHFQFHEHKYIQIRIKLEPKQTFGIFVLRMDLPPCFCVRNFQSIRVGRWEGFPPPWVAPELNAGLGAQVEQSSSLESRSNDAAELIVFMVSILIPTIDAYQLNQYFVQMAKCAIHTYKLHIWELISLLLYIWRTLNPTHLGWALVEYICFRIFLFTSLHHLTSLQSIYL